MDYRKEFRVESGRQGQAEEARPRLTPASIHRQDEAKTEIEDYLQEAVHQQALLYAEHKHSILVVLQALDAGGKDGTIKHVFTALNPQGTQRRQLQAADPGRTRARFPLARPSRMRPGQGEIVIFNRSHYEDVLVPRVHKLIDKATWTARYEHINDFEALLAENGTTILKFFLHISKEEQLARFAQRLDDPNRNWKISESDYTERALWDDYIEAFEDAIRATSTKDAPWYVIPSNHKWFRNLAVSQIMADTMEELKLAFPPPSVDLAAIRRKYHAAAKQEKASNKKA